MSAVPPGNERAGVSGHGPSSLADDIAGYVQGVEHTPGAASACVPYWDLVNWEQEAERLQQVLAEHAPIVDAVAQYGAAADALAAYRRDGAIQPGQIDEFLRRIGELAGTKNNARDALLNLARATPDAEEGEG